jgi:hypothetical protein
MVQSPVRQAFQPDSDVDSNVDFGQQAKTPAVIFL